MSEPRDATVEELKAIARLKRAFKGWPDTLMIQVGTSGGLNILVLNENNESYLVRESQRGTGEERWDSHAEVDTIPVRNTCGGDPW